MEGYLMWKTVGVLDGGKVLQQQYLYQQQPSVPPQERDLRPTDEHRIVAIEDLDGVGE
jgi:hypothetical protein